MTNKFFLIDDDSDDRELFSEALAAVDNSIVYQYAVDGEEALDKLDQMSSDEPDLIFLDINLPAMTGWQFLNKLKSSESKKHIPVVMYSTSSHARDRHIAKDLGALCFITKPHDYRQIKSVLAAVVSTVKAGRLSALCDELERLKTN